MAGSGPDHRKLAEQFRDECHSRGLASTHQRQVIYRVAASMAGHPTPEAIYDRVKREIPSISLATVYKNLKTFVEAGLMRELSPHHGSLRMDPNPLPHHHLICERCRSIMDLPGDAVEPVQFTGSLPEGFQVVRHSVEIIGVCARCAQRE